MPRTRPLYSGFFYSPLTEDVEELLARFQQTESVRYQVFSAIWREKGLADIFFGVSSLGELRRFCRITLATAVKYFLPPYSYQIRVGGLYLMFGFYHTQLAVPPLQIRLALRDWDSVQMFLNVSVDSGHHDVIYIYHKLVAAKAIHYTAMPHFLSFEKQRKPKKELVCSDFLGRATCVQGLISSDILEELSNSQGEYEKLMEVTFEVSSQVTMIHPDMAASLKNCMLEFITWQQKTFSQDLRDEDSGDDEDYDDDDDGDVHEKQAKAKSSSSRAKLLSSIKQKSYTSFQEAPKSRRHRKAHTVESSIQLEEEPVPRRKRPLSLRARTKKSLGMTQDETITQAWLLSAPENCDRLPVRRTNQAETLKA